MNSLRLRGMRISGRYRLAVTATDAAGNSSRRKVVRARIRRR
jgi:hypothetical protein